MYYRDRSPKARARQVAAIARHAHIAGYCAECTVTMASNDHVQAAIKTKNIAAGSVYTSLQEYLDSSEGKS